MLDVVADRLTIQKVMLDRPSSSSYPTVLHASCLPADAYKPASIKKAIKHSLGPAPCVLNYVFVVAAVWLSDEL